MANATGAGVSAQDVLSMGLYPNELLGLGNQYQTLRTKSLDYLELLEKARVKDDEDDLLAVVVHVLHEIDDVQHL